MWWKERKGSLEVSSDPIICSSGERISPSACDGRVWILKLLKLLRVGDVKKEEITSDHQTNTGAQNVGLNISIRRFDLHESQTKSRYEDKILYLSPTAADKCKDQ